MAEQAEPPSITSSMSRVPCMWLETVNLLPGYCTCSSRARPACSWGQSVPWCWAAWPWAPRTTSSPWWTVTSSLPFFKVSSNTRVQSGFSCVPQAERPSPHLWLLLRRSLVSGPDLHWSLSSMSQNCLHQSSHPRAASLYCRLSQTCSHCWTHAP